MTAKTKSHCLTEAQINDFLESDIETEREQQVMAHVATCVQCQQALEQTANNDQVWSEIKLHLVEQREDLDTEATHDEWDGGPHQRDLLKVKQMLGPTDNPEMIGRLGQYEVCGIIGRGSAGIVVKALDSRLNRFVAIKMLAPIYSTNGSSRRRFEREGRAIASVKDPNVVPIHTVGEYQGIPYIVMQYVPDGSLQQRIEREGPLSTRDVTCLGMQIANGLSAAHRRGIVHRDVKPANVLLESGVESTLVTDFGLARVVDEATMTRSGAISGTPQFMSPEQARGESVDPRSDLFSLGSVMYAACTGRSPFRAESVFGVIKRVCENEPRPIREFNPDIEPWLVALISKLHCKEPQQRFDSAEQVAELLSQELAHLENPTLVEVPGRDWWEAPSADLDSNRSDSVFGRLMRSRLFVGVVAASVAICLSFAAWQLWGNKGTGEWLSPGTARGNIGGGAFLANASPEHWAEMTPQALLSLLRQENQELEQFEHTTQKEIPVESGGKLILRTNLGSIDVKTHDSPVVKLVLVHSVGAKDQSTADKFFAATSLRYEPQGEDESKWDHSPESDALVIADFPIGKLTDQEIEQADDLEELKEQLLIRKNSHHRNAHFELHVPKQFNLDVQTMAGNIATDDMAGRVNLESYAGNITTGDISGDALLVSLAGNVVVGRVEGTLQVTSKAGNIEADQLDEIATLDCIGGEIEVGIARKPLTLSASGGDIRVWMAEQAVQASADAGSIDVNFVGQPASDSILVADAGGIDIGYVGELSFDISANTELGKVQSKFEKKRKRTLKHSLNGGESRLEARTSIGAIRFREIEAHDMERQYTEHSRRREASRAFQHAYDTHMAGRIDEAVALHQRAATYPAYRAIATYNLGCAYALQGKNEEALEVLKNAYDFGYRNAEQYQTDTDLDSLREEAEFKALMKLLRGDVEEDEQTNSCNTDTVFDAA